MLSTAPNKYAVIDPEGSIGPHMLVDIVIRHTSPVSNNCNVVDKFRISMQDHATKQVILFVRMYLVTHYMFFSFLENVT